MMYLVYDMFATYKDKLIIYQGFYTYLLSFIFFVLSVIVKEKEKKGENQSNHIDKQEQGNQNIVIDNFQKENLYIIGDYIYGIFTQSDIKHHICALSYSKDNSIISIMVSHNQEVVCSNLPISIIAKIKVKRRIIMQQEEHKTEDHSMADTVLATALFGSLAGTLVSMSSISQDIGNFNKVSYHELYEIQIIYHTEKGDKSFMMHTKTSPKVFFQQLSSLYEES